MAAFEIPDHFSRQFTTNTELLLQQKMPVMLQGVVMQGYTGEAAQVVKQFDEVEFQDNDTRHGDTNFQDIGHKQRWLFPADYDCALPVDRKDEIRMLDSPLSPYVAAMRAAWARKVNSVIVDGALGNNYTGKNGATTTAFDTTNQQIASSSLGLTVTKLRTAKEILMLNEVDEDELLYLAVTQKQITDMLETTEVTSSDYNTVKALVNGEVDTFMGFKFIRNNKLGVDGSSDRRCIAWCKSGIAFGQWDGLNTIIGPRPDKKYLTQVYMDGTIAACRTQEKKVVEILCTE